LERPLTDRQREILAVIVEAWRRGGPLPTHRCLCARFHWTSTKASADHLDALARALTIRRVRRGRARAYGLNLDHPDVRALLREMGGIHCAA